ncbi:hypothetical protein [Jidongwangia harbinensis]|uniref:hypothetical protein n=1 Tax=Jidongwangia harbinensis TaxID=2878561 RepID=UPI001CD9FFF7|nr:hypothetical protein [Jidongwangia harbinensis]MCA2218456.1 hypothetical protein [Jidongwangia harbinensis]
MSAQPELPLRPMTLGELLDAAMALLRRRALPLFGAAAVLAGAEQLALAPMRKAAYLSPPFYGPAEEHVGAWWAVTALGFGTEMTILTLLGAIAAAAAGPALLGLPVRDRQLWRRARPVATGVAAVLLGAMAAVGAFLGLLPWVVVFGLCAMTAPALVIDRARHPVGRSLVLAARSGLRGFWVLLVAYLTWLAIRFALGAGWSAIAEAVTGSQPAWEAWLHPVSWGLANTVAYAALACVSAVLLLDVRVRTEGLDIAVSRARSRGTDVESTLVHAP